MKLPGDFRVARLFCPCISLTDETLFPILFSKISTNRKTTGVELINLDDHGSRIIASFILSRFS